MRTMSETTRVAWDSVIHPIDSFGQSTRSKYEAAVRALYEQLMDGWNNGSGEAFAAPFAEQCDLVAFDGTHFTTRREIAAFHQTLFDKWLKGTRLVGEVKQVRFLSDDVAVMHAIGGTLMRNERKPSPARDSIQTLVAKRARWVEAGGVSEHTAAPDGSQLCSGAADELHRLAVVICPAQAMTD